jgi:hypothetical protein
MKKEEFVKEKYPNGIKGTMLNCSRGENILYFSFFLKQIGKSLGSRARLRSLVFTQNVRPLVLRESVGF